MYVFMTYFKGQYVRPMEKIKEFYIIKYELVLRNVNQNLLDFVVLLNI